MSLRRRLIVMIVLLVVAASAIFSAASLALLDRVLRAQLDARLATVARAAADIVDEDNGRPVIDRYDAKLIASVHDASEHISIEDVNGRRIYGEPIPSRAALRAYQFVRITVRHRGHVLGTLAAWQDRGWLAEVDRTALAIFCFVAIALALGAAFFARRYARSILEPLQRVATLAEEIEGRDLSRRLRAHGRDELARLCNSFDRMLERLEQRFEHERRFTADASHELRTPLAVVRAEVDLALRRPRGGDEYRAALASIGHEAARLEALVDALLDSARERAIGAHDTVDIADIVCSAAERVRPASRALRVHLPPARAYVRANRIALERAASAVLHNAIVHGGGALDVRVDLAEHDVRIDVRDRGPGFSPDALQHATERFWRGERGRSRSGSGLGLAIARAFIEAHGGRVQLANAEGGGASVVLLLPRVPAEDAVD